MGKPEVSGRNGLAGPLLNKDTSGSFSASTTDYVLLMNVVEWSTPEPLMVLRINIQNGI